MKQMRNAASSIPTASKLNDFFEEQLGEIYWAEKKLAKVLPKLEKAATASELKECFHKHAEQTHNHVTRLENIFEQMGKKSHATKCPAMAGITEEESDIIDDTQEGSSHRDAALIMTAQKAEHYEIATYGGLKELAKTMGYDDIAEILNETLNEEKETDKKLTRVAEMEINHQASLEPSTV
ncbi:MAG: ferritin-like domain-containing protein [Chitinophaga sp.]|uniref:ferritin-like domain-containing protein n=1 Tax=Chitinophaga sp. TaxID=1869181 RepID=UPI0025C2605D|nr:ferritin-like domain-containing protein [Chitinophaga sp.]MBV8251542.1 ferritin-like domain-containing protein [Chitinophaga sp.]